MKITDLKENQVVHCKTHEEAKRVLKLADEAGMKWCTNKSYIKYDMWNTYKDKTCYKFTSGSYADIPHYQSEGFEIISSEKIIDMENKTEFFEDKLMEVSDSGIKWYPRVVFGKKNGKYIAWGGAKTVEEAEKITVTTPWNYAREIDPFRELKEAFERGEDIQYRYKSGDWTDTPNPSWHPLHEYRIKPKPKYVPFTFEDAELFMNKTLIAKDKSRYGVITYAHNEGVEVGKYKTDYKSLFDDYTFIDGSPCGKEVEV